MLLLVVRAKEKNKLARKVFVERVQAIYSHSLTSEMSKGTSASHKTNGMDPSQLVVDADEEGQGSIMNQLQQQCCSRHAHAGCLHHAAPQRGALCQH